MMALPALTLCVSSTNDVPAMLTASHFSRGQAGLLAFVFNVHGVYPMWS